ncbi:uncharacterized protein LOC129952956 [Eupeodes corollae]|uniref:uncharacterized protein LOC129952956 n=1 Tax=Eupeodes corollae TaxID=290404 RepID=UPI00249132F0|nr:uncharacterized protein LOC129952956 [Eupeodes corollae]XP_055921914.1 uncharacterized protein LOC129952956 [Eupeodes corollae]XP_055921915.1 uncharacterized protein LOC129952956 [Eupeodes corollae]XP_055921916.1 uncharacterized protein LOC129952956 [Eupeodes corollae]
MWLNGLILVTVLAAAKSAEAELNVEAAFQGHCGHTSPCEQLCYEIHDGMYECDCIEGYELNKNGYSCQVINSTLPPDSPSKSEEDVLYQKGASFSAKLANGVNGSNQILSSGEDETDEYDEFISGAENLSTSHRKSNSYIDSNSKDYYISSDSISFNDDQLDLNPVPEFKNVNSNSKNLTNSLDSMYTDSETNELSQRIQWLQQQQNHLQHPELHRLNDKLTKSPSMESKENSAPALAEALDTSITSSNMLEDDYYSKLDMSVYDDVNNNKLNLRPVDANTYQNGYNQLQATSVLPPTLTPEPNKDDSLKKVEEQQRREMNMTVVTEASSSTAAKKAHSETPLALLKHIKPISRNLSRIAIDACPLDCGLDGVCDINDEGIPRCLCTFGKSGNGCLDDTKVRIPRFSKKSWLAFPALRGAYKHVQIRVEFRPESVEGIILLTGERDDLTGDFMALLIHQGFIEFWFDCGSGVGSVRSVEMVQLNQWNSVTIYRHRWDAWLLLNHGSRVQGRSKGLFSRITFREPVFLGGTGNITGLAKRLPVYEGMVGCIRRFVANEHEYSFSEHPLGDVSKGFDIQDCTTDKCYKYPCQHEGKCLPSDQGAICLCPMGFVGDLCELRLDLQVPSFNGSSYLRYAPLGDSALIWLELQVVIKPLETDGIILYTGHEHHGDFIGLSLDMGFVEFSFDLGSGPAIVRSDYPITTGQWHTIKVSRTARLAVLKVDELPEVMTISSNGFWHLSLPHAVYLGGVPNSDLLPSVIRYRGFFAGCIQKVKINSRTMSIVGEALGGTNVDNCPHACNAQPCGPLSECLPLLESYECRCGQFNPECNTTIPISIQTPDSIPKTTDISPPHTYSPPIGNNQHHHHHQRQRQHQHQQQHQYQHQQPNKHYPPKHNKSHYPQRQSTQFSSANSLDNLSHNSKSKRNRKTLKPTSVPANRQPGYKAKWSEHITPEMFYLEAESKDSPVDQYVDDAPISHDFHLPDSHHRYFETGAETPPKKDFHSDENDLQLLDMSVTHFQQTNDPKPPSAKENTQVPPTDTHYSKPHKHFGKKHQRSRYNSDLDKALQKGQSQNEEHNKHSSHQADSNVLQETQVVSATETSTATATETATGKPRKRLHKRPSSHRWKYHKKYNNYFDESRRPLHELPSSSSSSSSTTKGQTPDNGISIGYSLVVDEGNYHTKELFQDMERIMKNSVDELPTTTVPANKLETKTGTNYDSSFSSSSEQGPVIRKSLGACFTGTDSYFHYNDAETMSQIISYKIDLNLRIKTHSRNGVILWTGRQSALDTDDYLSLGIENGYLHLRYNLGSGEANVQFNVTRVSDGLWHRVRAIRNSQEGFLEVDGRKSVVHRSPGKLRQLNTDTGLYVGGMSDVSYFTRRRYSTGIIGCISEIILAGELQLNFDPATLGTAHNVETGIL